MAKQEVATTENSQTGTAVAEQEERKPIDLTQVPERVRQLVDRLKLSSTFQNTASIQLGIMDQILSATSEDEIFAAANAGTIAGKDVAGRVFLIHEHDWMRSAPGYIAQGAFPFYALCKVTFLDTGDNAVVNCGGFTFVSVLDALDRNGHLEKHPDGYPMVLEVRQTQNGMDVVIPRPFKMPQNSAPPAAA